MGKAAKKSVPTGKAAQITGKGAAAPPQIKDPFTQLWRHVRRDVARVAQKYNLVAVLQATVLIAFLSARQLSKWWVEEPVISCAEDQPLYERTPQLFTEADQAALLAQALGNPRATAHAEQQTLNPAAFSNSRGFLLKFNRDGASELARNDSYADLKFLLPYFDHVADPSANCFVMNVLIIAPGETSSAMGSGGAPADNDGGKPAVGLHVDNTVGIRSARKWLAHSVSVYYLQVPEGMDGGALELFTDPASKPTPDAVIWPQSGDHVHFRGDAYHRVTAMRPWRTSSGASDGASSGGAAAEGDEPAEEEEAQSRLRVGLVLEQYRIPASDADKCTKLEINLNDHRNYNNRRLAMFGFGVFNFVSHAAVTLLLLVGAWMHWPSKATEKAE